MSHLNWFGWILWGFLATLILSTASALLQAAGFTRLNLPYLLGSMFTPNRDRARVYGFFIHLLVGWVVAMIYVLIFHSLGGGGWWRGAIIGVVHGLFLLVVITSLLPGVHPRMASEQQGPEAANMLEPPGFFALNYGRRTPWAVLLTHTIFGAIFGTFYHFK
jgi:uncharacterized membrane protein YagU involved in acid resistance